jgi:hypothetical protein
MASSMAVCDRDLRAMVDIGRDPGDEFGAYGLPTAVLVGLKRLIAWDVLCFWHANAVQLRLTSVTGGLRRATRRDPLPGGVLVWRSNCFSDTA